LIRVTALHALRPRWSGSHKQIEEIARAAPVGLNPRLRLLAGFVDWDLSYDLEDRKDLPGALAAIDRATALGDYWLFLERRAGILAASRDYAGARRALDRAIELQPGSADLMTRRARYALRLKDYEAAGRDLLEGLGSIRPSPGASIFADVVKG
jgi:tetratricopeptide (TPR) repeat protein